ncbi:AraC family transcriptional regulator [Variovorax ginsengisoli]|uniref:AraC-like DNA-binding protein n=1 Tax=Variovorax ginsengisoli TaxID=363844 RepID=A0ABT9S6E0_9BURK|nr:helix-turn-helix transcriptional regulator [Variovorax ginsengisoli]MDP9899464.1 AraC-like DNA-binding protein [Variovorax ginsengisoli]
MQRLQTDPHDHSAFASWMTGVAADHPADFEIDFHRHARGQLLYALDGVMVVEATTGRWIVPPTTAVWLRPYTEHRLAMRSAVRIRSVLVMPDEARPLPPTDRVVHVSPLLRELIAAAAALGTDVCATARGEAVASLLLEELRQPSALPFYLPWPDDPRMAAVCRAITEKPAQACLADDWARSLAMSAKTFHRHFARSTGMNFGQWRLQARLLGAMDAIGAGQPLMRVALECGYESHSAFTQAFKRQFGLAPSKFLPSNRPAGDGTDLSGQH